MMARSRDGSTDEAEDTTAVRLFVQPSGYSEQPRRSARVKALRPPPAVRSAQPCPVLPPRREYRYATKGGLRRRSSTGGLNGTSYSTLCT